MMKKNHEKWSEKELEIIYLISMGAIELLVSNNWKGDCDHVPFV